MPISWERSRIVMVAEFSTDKAMITLITIAPANTMVSRNSTVPT